MPNKYYDVLKKELSHLKLPEKDINSLSAYIEKSASPGLLAPGVLSGFIQYAQEIGFPSTQGMLNDNLGTSEHKSDIVISALLKAKILETYEVPGAMVKDIVNRTAKEDREMKKNPENEIKVYDYHPDFSSSVGSIANKIKMKSEDVIRDGKKIILDIHKRLGLCESEDEFQDTDLFKDLDVDSLEKLSDGLLLALGELEASGKIHKFKSPGDAKTALLSAIKKLYQSRGLVGKEGRKFQRFGPSKILRNGRRDISKAMAHHESMNEDFSDDFITDIELMVTPYDLDGFKDVDCSFGSKKVNIKWSVYEEKSKWGIGSLTPVVKDQEIDIEYDLEVDGKKSSGTSKLKLPTDIDMELEKTDSKWVSLFPTRAEIVLSGDAKDPSTWKIKSMDVEWSC